MISTQIEKNSVLLEYNNTTKISLAVRLFEGRGPLEGRTHQKIQNGGPEKKGEK